jgi:hypothetical protein
MSEYKFANYCNSIGYCFLISGFFGIPINVTTSVWLLIIGAALNAIGYDITLSKLKIDNTELKEQMDRLEKLYKDDGK